MIDAKTVDVWFSKTVGKFVEATCIASSTFLFGLIGYVQGLSLEPGFLTEASVPTAAGAMVGAIFMIRLLNK